MNSRIDIKDIVTRQLKDILNSSELINPDKYNVSNQNQNYENIETDSVPKNFSKSIKLFVENHLMSDIDNHYKSLVRNTTKETWKGDACNLSEVLLSELKLSDVQESLFNILDSCVKEVNDNTIKCFNESDLDCSPLLQPKHIIQVAEYMSLENPLDVRLSALHCLLKSHFTDAVNGDSWCLLKQSLVDNLCDSNQDIFLSCLKAHGKLASCSSSIAIKECALNLMESLGRYYFLYNNEHKPLTFQSVNFHHMVYLTRLLLNTLREATLNIARFGDSKLDEMIGNFIHLINIHNTTRQSKNKSLLTPLEVVSYLDPNGKWLSNLTHFLLSRQLLFSSISKNISFIRVIIDELINWLSEPVLPSKHNSKVVQGQLNTTVSKYAMFCHSLSIFSTICSFSGGRALFPIKVTKKEDQLFIKDILNIIIKQLNEGKCSELLHTKATDGFKSFVVKHVAKILSANEMQVCSSLMIRKENDPFIISSITIQMFDTLSTKHLRNLFNHPNVPLKSIFSSFLQNFVITNNSMNIPGNTGTTSKQDIEVQGVRFPLETENTPPDEFSKVIADKLKSSSLTEANGLLKILTKLLKESDREFYISFATRQQIIHIVSETYMKLQQNLSIHESMVYNDDLLVYDSCSQLLLRVATSSLGFHILKEINMIAPLLTGVLQSPTVNWSDPIWCLFVFKSTSTQEGCAVLFDERDCIIKKDLTHLWNIIDEDCSGSDLPIEDASKNMLRIIANLGFSVKSIKSLTSESKYGSELTLIDESDMRPSNLFNLIQSYALNSERCPDFIHHEFALTVLSVIISNLDSSLYLENKFNYKESLLQIQAENRIDDTSEVIIDECSLLRHKIIEQSCFPNPLLVDIKPTHMVQRYDNQAKPRSRGTGELARWLSETRLGLHDNNWLKHARKLYKNSCSEDIKCSTILDLLEQVVKVFPEPRTAIKWENLASDDVLLPEEQLGVQLVMSYGAQHRLIQQTQQNIDNLSQLILLVKHSQKKKSTDFEGFDWFVASIYLLCSGNIEKTHHFLSSISGLPSAQLLWVNLAEESLLAQMGQIVETMIYEELPIAYQVLLSSGLSWWQMCLTWISQCWWNIFDWPQICHWFSLSILHPPDYPLYFCVALLQTNQDRLVNFAHEGLLYKIITQPIDNFQLSEARVIIERLHKKYHSILQPYFATN